MKQFIPFITLVLSVSISSSLLGAPHQDKINRFIEQQLPNTHVGLIIQDPTSSSIVYENGAKSFFYPASNTKLFSSAAALKYFGSEFKYQTTLHADLKKLNEGVLSDDLTLIFRGDPSLTVQDLRSLLGVLKTKGIKKITGNLIIDDKTFSGAPYAPGWTWDSIPWYYSAPITSIILNENKVRFKVAKVEKIGSKLHLKQHDKSLPSIKLKADVVAVSTQDAKKKCQLSADIQNNAITLNGCWPISKTPYVMEFALDNPQLIAKSVLKTLLAEYGVTLSGEFRFKKAAKDLPVIMTKRSKPMKSLLIAALTDSNNVYSESFTKALGIAYAGKGTFQAGVLAMLDILAQETQIDFSKVQFSDGSGQSRYNLVSPHKTAELLSALYRDPQFGDFYDALSVSGKTGTLATRMKNNKLIGKVVAKTGSAIGTSTLSGYLTAESGKQYVFSLMINQSDKDYYALKSFEDKLCLMLLEEPWNSQSQPKDT